MQQNDLGTASSSARRVDSNVLARRPIGPIAAAALLAVLGGCGGGGSDTGTATAASANALATAASTEVHALANVNDPGWTTVAGEHQSYTVNGTRAVRYGIGASFVTQVVSGDGECSNEAFGSDPQYGTVKLCQVGDDSATPGFVTIAGENEHFSVNGTQTIRYGANGAFVTKVITDGSDCSNAGFGNDPLVGTVKSCQIATATATSAGTAPIAPVASAAVCNAPVAATDTSQSPATVGDGTPGSCTESALRAAIGARSVVTFNCGAAPATIAIRSAIDIPTNRDTVIDGGNRITLDGGNATRVFSLKQDNYRTNTLGLTLQHIAVTNAKAPGGGYVAPDPNNPSCANGFASGGGAAIEVRDARLHVIDVDFRGNAGASPGPDIAGGAIYATGSLDILIEGSRFDGNSGSNGGAVGMLQSNLRVYNSNFTNNQANGDSTNDGNVSTASCQGVAGPGQAGAGGGGGAIYIDGSDDADVTVCGSTFTGNHSNAIAGALVRTANGNARTFTIDRSTFTNNSSRQAGAVFLLNAAPLTIAASTFAGNKATAAGAVQLSQSQFNIVNSTFSGNEATKGVAGALLLNGNGSSSRIQNVTFADNKASGGAGYFSAALFGDLNFAIDNTAFANNTTDDAYNPMQCGFNPTYGSNDLQWPRNRVTGNLADTECVGSIAFADPVLGALADNTGPTPTRLPASNSALRGAGRNCPPTDQRGNPRNQAGCTIGAVE